MLNSLHLHRKNCMVDNKEDDKFDLGVKGLIITLILAYGPTFNIWQMNFY